MIKKIAFASAAIAAFASTPASAAVQIVVEGGGTPVVFEGDNGNRFAVLGVDARGGTGGAVTEEFIQNSITSGGDQFVGAFSCTGGLGALSCGEFANFTVNPGQRIFDNLLLEFSTGNNATFDRVVFGGSATLGLGNITRQGQPPIGAPVPEPATWAMMLLGFFGIGGALRSRRNERVNYSFA